MGLFDTFIVKVKCPYCKEEWNFSKSFDCTLNTYKVGDRLIYCPIENGRMKNAIYDSLVLLLQRDLLRRKDKELQIYWSRKPVKEE